jgi:hypothetical protein
VGHPRGSFALLGMRNWERRGCLSGLQQVPPLRIAIDEDDRLFVRLDPQLGVQPTLCGDGQPHFVRQKAHSSRRTA